MARNMLVAMAYEIIKMDDELQALNEEVQELREFKRETEEKISKSVNDSVNQIHEVIKAILNKEESDNV